MRVLVTEEQAKSIEDEYLTEWERSRSSLHSNPINHQLDRLEGERLKVPNKTPMQSSLQSKITRVLILLLGILVVLGIVFLSYCKNR